MHCLAVLNVLEDEVSVCVLCRCVGVCAALASLYRCGSSPTWTYPVGATGPACVLFGRALAEPAGVVLGRAACSPALGRGRPAAALEGGTYRAGGISRNMGWEAPSRLPLEGTEPPQLRVALVWYAGGPSPRRSSFESYSASVGGGLERRAR